MGREKGAIVGIEDDFFSCLQRYGFSVVANTFRCGKTQRRNFPTPIFLIFALTYA
jgi:hypothetical protein